jgi:hypothetical protein
VIILRHKENGAEGNISIFYFENFDISVDKHNLDCQDSFQHFNIVYILSIVYVLMDTSLYSYQLLFTLSFYCNVYIL